MPMNSLIDFFLIQYNMLYGVGRGPGVGLLLAYIIISVFNRPEICVCVLFITALIEAGNWPERRKKQKILCDRFSFCIAEKSEVSKVKSSSFSLYITI